jgi:hypothetical protein
MVAIFREVSADGHITKNIKTNSKTDSKEIQTLFVICTSKNTTLKMSTIAGRNKYVGGL